jgi:hypothetical protein
MNIQKDKLAQLSELQSRPKTLVLAVHTKAPAEATQSQIDKIKPFMLREFSADELYIRQMMLANDQADRSFERFDMGYLARFAETIVGKSVLTGHDYGTVPVGRFFDAEITRDAQGWQWVAPWFYMPKSPGNQLDRDNIDSGVWSYVSIGAKVDYAGLYCDICGMSYYGYGAESEAYCRHYAGREYDGKVCTCTWDSMKSNMSTVEAVEGSIVYLGCQYDAAIAKSAEQAQQSYNIKLALMGKENNIPSDGREEVNNVMNETEIKQLKDDLAAKTTEAETLTNKVKTLEPLAEIGKELKEDLKKEVIRLAQCCKCEAIYNPVIESMDVPALKAARESLEKQWNEMRGITTQAEGEQSFDESNKSASAVVAGKNANSYSVI